MKRPNFFMLGAPKCGTTSMAEWLGAHPAVFMSSPKEPTYFCTDLLPDRPRDPGDYERLFTGADERHQIVGEASTGYLYSRAAVDRILDYSPNARFLVMIRNPIEMAHALHGEQLYQGSEDVTDFETAWALQERRAEGERVPPGCHDPQLLMYGPFCRLGAQLDRLYARVSPTRVHVVVLDDVKRDPRREYLRVLDFLGLADDGRRVFPVRNVARARKSVVLGRLTRTLGTVRRRLGPTYRGFGLLNRVNRWNREKRARSPLSPEMREKLTAYFRPDVRRLGELLRRDFGPWLGGP